MAFLYLLVAALALQANAAACPATTRPTSVPWAPVAWRGSLELCVCPTETFCRGAYCEVNGNGRHHSFVLGCAHCRCLPRCRDASRCGEATCVCDAEIRAVDQLWALDPRSRHPAALVQSALSEAFPEGLPPAFDTSFKNPCWRRADGTLACIPFAYIAGFLKCATTVVFAYLEQHPDVCIRGMVKETHWWSRYRRPYTPGAVALDRVFQAQTTALSKARDPHEAVFLDGSVSMFWESNYGGVLTPELVRAVTPDARFVLMVRDPADRLYSDYIYFAYRTQYGKSSDSHLYTYDARGFHNAVVQSLAVMRECLAANPAIVCAVASRRFRTTTQIQIGMYATFLQQWLSFFPLSQFLVLRQEDIATAPRRVMAEVTTFLGLAPLSATVFREERRPNAINRRGYSDGMLPETRQLLNDFYAPYNELLSRLLKSSAFNYHNVPVSQVPLRM